ncbi:SseB family protein [Modestobacter versicolor]|uniref:SseB protein N-terminal domain-containing protein n=1 Tax=Modestobacter versicolor TaxID=429133 RepID=A0A839YA23_9ACTN|nr:SseB family protein [Modestobacter versicolor]MBB3677831.1 hypothetical protein [Modestobacter versicolor]
MGAPTLATQLAEALDAGAVATALALLRPAQLLLPLTEGVAAGDERPGWATVTGPDRVCLVAFTSVEALQTATGGAVRSGRVSSLPELAAGWPDPRWGLVVDPGLPSHLVLEPGTVARLAAPSLAEQVAAEPDVPFPLLQQLVPHAELAGRLAGETRVSGYVHQLPDVLHIATPVVLVDALGRSAEAAALVDPDGAVHLLRWPAVGPELYRSAHGGTDEAGRDAVAGWLVEDPPFVGLGLAPNVDQVVREHRVHGVELPHGAQLWQLGHDGEERQVAVLDGDLGTWVTG